MTNQSNQSADAVNHGGKDRKLAHELTMEEICILAYTENYAYLHTCLNLVRNRVLSFEEAMQTAAVEQAKLVKKLQAELLKYKMEEPPQPIIRSKHHG